jgi:ubiquitin-conjugating enzyme E2 C
MGLPKDVLRTRLKNEVSTCHRYLRHGIEISDEDLSDFPLEIRIEIVGVPALKMDDGQMVTENDHMLSMIVNEEYPFEKPLVLWRTPIFHPNIMLPEDGGHVCIKLLDDWSFNSTLLSFIKGIETMLQNPNPSSPFGTQSCTAAAEYFNSGKVRAPPVICKTLPKVVKGD